MVKRSERPGPAKPPRARPQPAAPAWPAERHSGEGSASALETLQKMAETRRQLTGQPLPPADDEPPRSS